MWIALPSTGTWWPACAGDRVYLRRYLQQPEGIVLAGEGEAQAAAEKFHILGVVVALHKEFP